MKKFLFNLKPIWQGLTVLQLLVFFSIGRLQAQATVTEFQMRGAINELTEATKVLFQNPSIRAEVYYLAKNSLFNDRYVGLPDLMSPQTSQVYVKSAIPNQFKGSFKNSMTALVNSNLVAYPTISQFFNAKSNQMGNNFSFFTKANLYFYVPYVEDYEVGSFDPVIVPALEEANVANGYIRNREGTGYTLISGINDAYAELNPTLIITPEVYNEIIDKGDPPSDPVGPRSSCCVAHECCEDNIRQVHAGWARLTKQLDAFISLNGNGGGSEMKWLRVFGTLATQPNGDIVASASATLQSQDYSRRDIRRENWKWWGGTWNADWDCDEVNNLMVVYEQDNEGTVTLNGSLKRTFTNNLGGTVGTGVAGNNNGVSTTGVSVTGSVQNGFEANIGFSSQWTSKDEIVVQDTREEDEFFVINTMDQGCGMREGKNIYDNIDHPVYNCGGTYFRYNLPNRCVERQ
jgi:hypothetical protein